MATQHEYYPKGENNDFYFLPTPRTVTSLEKMAMMIRSQNGTLKVLFDVSKTELLWQRFSQASDKDLKLSFMLFSRNPYFINITDIPVDIQGKVFYLSNKHLNFSEKGLLHDSDFVEKEQLISLTSNPLEYNEVEKTDYSLFVDNGGEQLFRNIKHGDQISVKSLEEGCCRVFANNKIHSTFINLGAKTKNSPIGFIDIFLGSKMKANILSALENNEVPFLDYKIRFNARSVYWKYNIVPLHIKRIKSLKVNCQKGSSKLSFKGLGEFDYNENRMHSFITDKPVKYNKQYDYEIQLKKQEGEGGGKVLVKNLAYAPFDAIKPLSEKHYMSEIYVYI